MPTPSKDDIPAVVCKHSLLGPVCNHCSACVGQSTVYIQHHYRREPESGLLSVLPSPIIFPSPSPFHQTPPIYEGVKAFNGILKILKAKRFV